LAVDITMKRKPHFQGKILNHSGGLGVPSPETVRVRAWELARIAGHEEVTEADWAEAKQELHGCHGHLPDDDDEEMAEAVSQGDMVAGSLGHRRGTVSAEEPENVVEELIAEGMEEAEHEQMLEASRNHADMEEETEG
jgi:hypothetical protein